MPVVTTVAMQAPHLLLFGWHREGTGFTRVLQALLPHLAQVYRITWMGVGYQGPVRQLSERVQLRPTNLRGGDLVGAYGARKEWPALAVDAVLALNDPWYLEHYSRELTQVLDGVPMFGYLPLDGEIPDPEVVRGLRGFSALFTYTTHAAGELRQALRACGDDTAVLVAGHGVELGAFAPTSSARAADFAAPERMQQAQRLFGLSEPSWVVLNASRPDPRKRLDLTLEGFARFVRGRPGNVRLCLHHAIAHPQFVEPLRQQAQALGIAERVLWWPPQEGAIDDASLCALYNACAVGLNTSLGEGFGLVSFEHAATGAPQLVPDHAALRELWGDAALRIGPVRPMHYQHSPLRMGEIAAEQIADALHRVYDDAAFYGRLARAGLDRCRAPDLRWSVAAESLLRGIRSVRCQTA
jgi:glycosyltransferase involved in cell wall biosynthesis